MKKFFNLFILLSISTVVFSQGKFVSGKVLDASNSEPLIGVNISVKGTTIGTNSDVNGNYSIKIESNDAELAFSFIGYDNMEIPVGNRTSIDVQLVPSVEDLGEVVVTALGLKREKKALGYSVSDVSGEDMAKSEESNILNSLSGKVPGLQVTSSSGGVNSSSRVILRGESSLVLNNNQPLFVVDGIPVSNNIDGYGTALEQDQVSADYGNGAGEINANDIESISVLKGPAAAALYGSRAANGVIMITTKSGKGAKKEGIGVSVSSNSTFSSPLRLWDMQSTYGGGWGKSYLSDYGTNFGPVMDGSQIAQDGSPDYPGTSAFIKRFDLNDFFQTGQAYTNTVALSGANEDGNFRLSYTNLDKKGIVPNTDVKRNTVSLNAGYNLTDKFSVKATVNYVNSASDNLPLVGYSGQGLMYNFIWSYLNYDLNWQKDYWEEGQENVQQNYLFSWGNNPWMQVHENLNGFNKDRIYGNILLNLDLTDHLTLMGRIGTDWYYERRQSQRALSTVWYDDGMYYEQTIGFKEINADFLLTYDNKLGDNLGVKVSAGGNRMNRTHYEDLIQGDKLSIPGVYNLGNIAEMPTMTQYDAGSRINSLYAFAELAYKNSVFFDVTARNDWSSTLTYPNSDYDSNNSYFYPSFSLSTIMSEMLNLPGAISFWKLRASWAEVGKDTDPYQLKNYYDYGTLANSVTSLNTLLNESLKPEKTQSFEVGTDIRFLKNRIKLDLTYYKNVSKNQILPLPVSATSGYDYSIINAGQIENQGYEVMLNLVPVKLKNSFTWNIDVNWSTNKSKVVKLTDGLDNYVIGTSMGGQTVEARVGGEMGDLYGYVFDRTDDGKIIFSEGGTAQMSSEMKKWGNYNPDWIMGVTNTFSFKGISLSALFDIRHGGTIVSYTNAVGAESGILKYTMYGRELGDDYGIIPENAVIDNGDGSYREFTESDLISPETYYYGNYYDRSNIESNSFDASYVKFRQLSLGYTFPKAMVEKLKISDLTLSLVGRNLKLWTDVPDIDPETATNDGGTLIPGFELVQLPSTKSWGCNLSFNF